MNAHELPSKQREVLVDAVQSDGHKVPAVQRKALAKKGLLDDDGKPTAKGKDAVEDLGRALDFRQTGSLPAFAIGVLSEDGETVLVTTTGPGKGKKNQRPGVRYIKSTMPESALIRLGLN